MAGRPDMSNLMLWYAQDEQFHVADIIDMCQLERLIVRNNERHLTHANLHVWNLALDTCKPNVCSHEYASPPTIECKRTSRLRVFGIAY